MGSSLCEALLPSQALRRQNPGVMGFWQLRSHGTRVSGIGQDVVHGGVDWLAPLNPRFACSRRDHRQGYALLAEPNQDLPYRLKLGEPPKHQIERIAYSLVGILLDPLLADLHVAHSNSEEELAAARLLPHRLHRALSKDRELHLAHRALHPQEESVVDRTRIVNAFLVHQQRANEATELKKSMPVAAIASQPRGLDREDGTDAAGADGGKQSLEAGTHGACPRAAEIVVNDHDFGPAYLPRAINQPVLPPLALKVVLNLVIGRLTNVDVGAARQVVRRDLGHRPSPR